MLRTAWRRTARCAATVALLCLAGPGLALAQPPATPTDVPAPPAPPPFALPAPPPWLAQSTPGLLLAPANPEFIDIPALGVRSDSMVPLGRSDDGTMDVPADGQTAGWYTGAPSPGALGPAVVVAHVDWQGAPGLFHDLAALPLGATLNVGRADGQVAVFRVRDVKSYAKDAFPTDLVYGRVDYAALRLITCGGDFDTQQRSYRDNVVAFAELVEVQA